MVLPDMELKLSAFLAAQTTSCLRKQNAASRTCSTTRLQGRKTNWMESPRSTPPTTKSQNAFNFFYITLVVLSSCRGWTVGSTWSVRCS